MRFYRKNVIRLALKNKGSFVGALIIIALGILVYVSMFDTLQNLTHQILSYYEQQQLADVFASVSGISPSDLSRFEEIPGIAKADGKLSADLRILIDGQEEIASVHLLSYSEDASVNRLSVGGSFSGDDDIFIGVRMTDKYGLKKGDRVRLICGDREETFTYAGTCAGPDYIYSIPPGGGMMPDGEVYDIACLTVKKAEELTGKRDSLTELGFTLRGGYTYDDVRYVLSERLAPYGLSYICEQKKQASWNMVNGEMGELIATGTLVPILFMGISIFMLYIVLKKMIENDRMLIGTMKAMGMTDRELVLTYLCEGALLGAAGAAIGCAAAGAPGRFMFAMYVDFFNLSDTVYHSYAASRLTGVAIAVLTGAAAAWFGVRSILRINPSQAMKAKAPASVKSYAALGRLTEKLEPFDKISVRSMSRSPLRGVLIILAVALPFSLMPIFLSFNQLIDGMFMMQFSRIQVYDLQLSLDGYRDPVRVRQAGEALEYVTRAEAICADTVRVSKENHSEYTALYGLNRGSDMWNIVDCYGREYEPPDDGIILNVRTAGKLGVAAGDTVEVALTSAPDRTVELAVTGVVEENFGSNCYMSRGGAGNYLLGTDAANALLIDAQPGRVQDVKAQILDTLGVAWTVDPGKTLASYSDIMSSMTMLIAAFAVMSIIAAVVLIYNVSMINIRDRMPEIGTLTVLGASDGEISKMLLKEQLIYMVLGLIAGYPGGKLVTELLRIVIVSEDYSIDLSIMPDKYLLSVLICLAITIAAWIAQTRYIKKISLTDILKERE